MKRAVLIACAAAFFFACSDGGSEPANTDAGAQLDAGFAPVDAGPVPNPPHCKVDSSLGTLSSFTLVGSYYGTDQDGAWLQGNFAYNDDRDVVVLELYEGKGAFSGPPAVGTYPLTGAELNYATCGVCVLLAADYADGGPSYFATGGSVTLSSVNGQLTGILDDVTFGHVTIDEVTHVSTPVDDGCASQLERLTFDDELMENW